MKWNIFLIYLTMIPNLKITGGGFRGKLRADGLFYYIFGVYESWIDKIQTRILKLVLIFFFFNFMIKTILDMVSFPTSYVINKRYFDKWWQKCTSKTCWNSSILKGNDLIIII